MTDRLDSFTRSQWIVIEDDAGIVRRAPFETLLFSIPIRVANGPEGPRIHRLDTGEALPVLRRYGYVWSALDPAPRPLFEVPEFDEAGRRFTPCGPVGVKTSALRVIENFLDLAHFPFVHPGILGTESETEVIPYRVEIRRDVDEVWAVDCGFFQPKAMAASSAGAQVEYRYRVAQPCSAVLYKTSPGRAGAFDLIGILVRPLQETACEVHAWMLMWDEESSDESLLQFQQEIFLQDRIILENQIPHLLPLSAGMEIPTRADATSIAYRRWLKNHGVIWGTCEGIPEVTA